MAEGSGSGRTSGAADGPMPPSQFYSKKRPEGATACFAKPKVRGMVQALTLDQVRISSRPHRYKKAYLDYRLSSCDRMYSKDILGHHGCVNALAFSKGEEQYLATGGVLNLFIIFFWSLLWN